MASFLESNPSPLTPSFIGVETAAFNQELQKSMALQGAISLAAMNNPVDSPEFLQQMFTSFDSLAKQSPEQIRTSVNGSIASQDIQAAENVVSESLKAGDPNAPEQVKALPQVYSQVQDELANKKDKFESDFVDNVSDSFGSKVLDEVKFNVWAANRMQEFLKEHSPGFWDWAGLLVSDEDLTWQKILDAHIFASEDEIVSFLQDFRARPVEEKKGLWIQLEHQILKNSGLVGDNPLKALSILQKFIDPLGESSAVEDAQMARFEHGLDLSIVGPPLVRGLAGFRRFRKAAAIAQAADEKVASSIEVLAAADKEFADKLGIKQEDAIAQSSLIDQTPLDPDFSRIMAHNADKKVRNLQNAIDKQFEDVKFIEEGALWQVDKDAARSRILKDEAYHGPDLISTTFGKETENFQEIIYKIGTKSGGYFRTKGNANKFLKDKDFNGTVKKDPEGYYIEYKQIYDFKIGDIKRDSLTGETSGLISRHVASPTSYLFDISPEITRSATRVELINAAIAAQLHSIARATLDTTLGKTWKFPKTAGRAMYDRVNRVLLEGDAKETSYGKFALKYGFRLNDKEIAAYFGMRRLFDNLFWLRNDAVRKELKLRGFKYLPTMNKLGKVYDTFGDAYRGVGETDVLYDATRGIENTAPDFQEIYDQGKMVVRLDEPIRWQAGLYDYAIVPKTDIQDLPYKVLQYRKGYVPKLNKKAYYFVRQFEDLTLNGKQVEGGIFTKTLRITGSKADANEIVAREVALREKIKRFLETGDKAISDSLKYDDGIDVGQVVKDIQEHKFSLSTNIKPTFDRQLSDLELAYEKAGPSGGLFTGSRSSSIGYGLDSAQPERFDAFESLQRNVDNLSGFMSRNEWRIGMEKRILERWRPYLQNPNAGSLNTAVLKPGVEKTKIGQGFLAAKNHLERQLNIPGLREAWYGRTLREFAEWTEGKGPDWLRHSIINFSRRDPVSLMRASAFNTLLGFYNIAQLYVQAQGASISASIHPIYGARATAEYAALRSVIATSINKPLMGSAPRLIKYIAEQLGMDPADLAEYRKLFVETGLRDSVFELADYEPAAKGIGITSRAVNNVLKKGLLFYREGELFNRGIALRIAQLKWRDANPGKVMTNQDIKEVTSDAVRLTLNLYKANAAEWQRGLLSVPTQFLQIQAKFLEATSSLVLPGKEGFTRDEATKLIIGQMLLYGSTGYPFGEYLVNGMAAMMNRAGVEINQDSLSPEMVKYLKGGIPDMLAYSIFGANVELGGRSAIANDVTNILTSLFRGDFTPTDLGGAFGATTSRFWNMFRGFGALIIPDDWENFNYKITKVKIETALQGVAAVASSTNNAQKAWIWYNTGNLINRRGKVVTDIEPNLMTAVALAMGFQPTVEQDYYRYNSPAYRDERIKEQTELLVPLIRSYLAKGEREGFNQVEYDKLQSIQWLLTDGMSDDDKAKLRDSISNELFNEGGLVKKRVDAYVNAMDSNLLEDISILRGNRGNLLNTLTREEFYPKKEEKK